MLFLPNFAAMLLLYFVFQKGPQTREISKNSVPAPMSTCLYSALKFSLANVQRLSIPKFSLPVDVMFSLQHFEHIYFDNVS